MGVVGEYQQKSQNFGLMKIPTDPFLHFLDGQQGTKVTTGTHIKHCTTDRACGFYSSLTGRKDAWNSNTCHFWKHNGTQNSKHTLVWRALTFLGHSVCMGNHGQTVQLAGCIKTCSKNFVTLQLALCSFQVSCGSRMEVVSSQQLDFLNQICSIPKVS